MASRAWRSIDSVARLGALAGTALLLVATSAPYDDDLPFWGTDCRHEEETLRLSVSEGCGPAGVMVLHTAKDQCGISVMNADALRLPPAGRFVLEGRTQETVSLRDTPWALVGPLNPAPADAAAPSDANDTDASPAGFVAPLPPRREEAPASRRCTAVLGQGGPERLECTGAEDTGAPSPRCTARLQILP
jgi:hypothetical protein